MTTVLMIDTVHGSVRNIPPGTPKVAGYVSGTASVKWTSADWALFPDAGKVRITQGYGAQDWLACDVIDAEELETGGWTITPAQAAQAVKARVGHGIAWTTVYGSPTNLGKVAGALDAVGASAGWWHGHVRAWVANWDLDEAGAAALVGTTLHRMPVVAVQWASPSSNPRTVVPGGTATLAEANLDLSVTDPGWHPPPKPAPTPAPEQAGYVVPQPSGTPFAVTGRLATAADVGKPAWF